MTFKEKLLKVQTELKAPKDQYNDFGKYNYRSCESILEAVKPLLYEYGLLLIISDRIVAVCDRIYVEATCTLIDAGESNDNVQTTASAREPQEKKGMDDSQITGSASSYARKYALSALFALDDTKDADTNEHQAEVREKAKKQAQKKAEEKPVKKEKTMLDGIRENCAKSGIPEAWICELYKVDNLEDLRPASQKTLVTQWDKFYDKYADELQQGNEDEDKYADELQQGNEDEEEYYENILDMYGGQR